jgi:S1-C subfamily serine protease
LPPRHLLAGAALLLAAGLAHATPMHNERQALREAALRVVRVEAKSSLGTRQGSGVVVALDPHKRWVDVATTYHTLRGADSVSVHRSKDGVTRRLHVAQAPILMWAKPALDFALLRVPLRPQAPNMPPPWKLVRTKTRPSEVEAFALGFPAFVGGKQLTAVRVKAHGRQPAARVLMRNLQRHKGWLSYFESWLPKSLDFAFLLGPPTAPGMSGGAVVSPKGELLGLIWGRLADRAGIFVPADQIAALLSQAKLRPLPWPAEPDGRWLGIEGLQAQLSVDCPQDELDWDDFDEWLEAFSAPAATRERFQEVSLPLEGLPPGGKLALELQGGQLIGEAYALEVWANGAHGALTAKSPTLDLTPHLQPGDNLLILKLQGADPLSEGADVGRLLRSKGFDLRVTWTAKGASSSQDAYRIRRTLPAAVRGFAVYASLRLPAAEGPSLRGVVGRLGVALAPFKAALERLTLALPLQSGDGVSRVFSGTVTLAEPPPPARARLQAAAPDVLARLGKRPLVVHDAGSLTWDVSVQGLIKIHKAVFRGFGASLVPKGQLPHIAFAASIRVQLVNGPQGVFVALRAKRLVSDQSFRQTVLRSEQGIDLSLDLTRLIHEGLLQWFNGQILHAPQPRPLKLADLLAPIDLQLASQGRRLPALPGVSLARVEQAGGRLRVYLRDAAVAEARLPRQVTPDGTSLDLLLVRSPGVDGAFKRLQALVPPGGQNLKSLWVGLTWTTPQGAAPYRVPALSDLTREQVESLLRALLPKRVDMQVKGW